ncbi:MAG: hypothetical protein IJ109_03530 [Firmicutes bacterium]|nr:hypothetical protein [Bacillota bacterium]
MKNRYRLIAVILAVCGILALGASAAAAQQAGGSDSQSQPLHYAVKAGRPLPDLFSVQLPRWMAGSEAKSWETALKRSAQLAQVDHLIAAEEMTRQIPEEPAVELEDEPAPLAEFEPEEASEEEDASQTQAEEEPKDSIDSGQEAGNEPEEPAQEADEKEETFAEAPAEKPQEETAEEPAQAPESRADWEKTLPKELPESLRAAILAVARSQIDYQEDAKEARAAGEDGAWTRYGAFLGEPYADPWDAEFALFTLHYAGAFDVLAEHPAAPADADTVQWIRKLRSEDRLLSGEEYQPKSGDLVFLNVSEPEGKKSARAAIVTAGGEDSIRVIGAAPDAKAGRVQAYRCSVDDVLAYAAVTGGDEVFANATDLAAGAYEEEAETEAEEEADAEGEAAVLKEQTLICDNVTLEGHLPEDGAAEEIRDVTVEDGKVLFEASGFSVYAIVQGPQPFEPQIRTADALEKLTGAEAADGFYLSVTRGTQNNYYIQNTLNANSAFNETTNISGACPWFFEAADGGAWRIYTMTEDVKQYIRNTGGNLVGLSETEGTLFTITETPGGTFEIKSAAENKWLQHSGGGSGLRLYTDNKNAGNCRFSMVFVSSLSVTDDPYGLDGAVRGLMNYSNGTSGEALMASEKNTAALRSQSLAVRVNPMNRSETLYVARDADITMWTFHLVSGDLYTLSADVDGQTKYLKAEAGGLSLTDEEGASALQAVFGTGEYAGRLRLVAGDRAVSWEGTNGFKTAADSSTSGKLYLYFTEPSSMSEDDFVVYSASKVSVSDTEAVAGGSRVIIYTRTWDDDAKRYVFYAVDHDGSLVPCYESGDAIQWVGSKINTLLWSFTEYYYEDTGEPNNYYDLKNPYSGRFIAPQIGGGQYLSFDPVGINLNGRKYGDYYSTIVAWDDPYYAYAGLKVEDGKIVSCPFAEAEDFYFAVMQDAPEAGTLTEAPTVDHTQYGITMKLANYSDITKIGGMDTTAEQHAVLGDSSGGAVSYANSGLVTTDLKEDGYPLATKTDRSLGELFAGGQEVNHLFVGSTYSGSGYYEFDSTQNFASLKEDGNFKVYKELGTADNSNKNSLKHGQFFPYNDLDPSKLASVNGENLYSADLKALPDNDPRKYEPLYLVPKPDYYFGVEIEAAFVQTPNGHDAWGHDIIYEFTGDDDFWLYVDGELVIDLGGIHSALPGSVNYCTGEVMVNGKKTTLKEVFESNFRERGLSEQQIDEKIGKLFEKNSRGQYIFKEYSTHTMKIFFMERGGGASNLHMRFNLSSVRPGRILLNKQISGTDKKDYKLAEYGYQILYESEDKDGGTSWKRLSEQTKTSSRINVSYQNTNVPVKYAAKFTPAGASSEYRDVFFLTPGQTAAISLPEGALRYRIIECGLNTQVYDEVRVNDGEIQGKSTADANRRDYETTAAPVSERQRVVYDNHVSAAAKRTLTITKKLYDESDQLITDDPAGFSFRLWLGGENDTELAPAALQDYCVKDPEGNYCRWDAEDQRFVSLGETDFGQLSDKQRLEATFQTSFNGAISKIPAEYRVEVRDLLVGTQFKVEERAGEVPAGYQLIGYAREGNSYITKDGSDNLGTIRENESPAIEVHNRRGFGLTVQKNWSDASFTQSHGDVFFAVFVKDQLQKDSIRVLKAPQTSVYYYWDSLKKGCSLSDYEIREVALDGDYTADSSSGAVALAEGCRVTAIDGGGSLSVTAKSKEDQKEAAYEYAVSYKEGKITGAADNVRTDTVTNSRHGIRLIKQDAAGRGLAGAVFTLTDARGNPIGADSYVSDENGQITIAYVNTGTKYLLTETKSPKTVTAAYYGLQQPLQFRMKNDGTVKVSGASEDAEVTQGNEDAMPVITVRNRPVRLRTEAGIVRGDAAEEALPSARFALYREVTVDGVTSIDYTPIAGYEDLVSDENGLIAEVNESLDAGTYFLKEKSVPEGYGVPAEEPVRFTVSETGAVTLTDTEGAELTGEAAEDGTMVFTLKILNREQLIPSPTGVDPRYMPYICLGLLALLLAGVMILGRRAKVVK